MLLALALVMLVLVGLSGRAEAGDYTCTTTAKMTQGDCINLARKWCVRTLVFNCCQRFDDEEQR